LKEQKKSKKKIWIAAISLLVMGSLCFGGYLIYGSYKLTKLATMSSAEMIAYTTNDVEYAIITIGIISQGQVSYTVYGENGMVMEPKEYTYEIGSITKTFTTSLLCKAISENKIQLDDPIDKYLQLPKKDYYPTIRSLVTHTSGYKKYYFERPMISNFLNGQNDYYGITGNMLVRRIGNLDLENKEYKFSYSNFGLAAVGAVLEKVYNKDYAPLMDTYIKNDLGLDNTKISTGTGDLAGYWEWSKSDAYLPAGALLSNISDMLAYAQMQLQERPTYLSLAHQSLAEIHATSDVNKKMEINLDEIGVGWVIDKENNITWHNGATGNFNSYIGFDKDSQIAVVVLSNLPPKHRIPATVIGIEILTDLQNKVN
jgi:CubicO group peptidase (beta-lactamase class C family)